MFNPSPFEILGTVLFGVALLHSFFAGVFGSERRSKLGNLLGQIEIAFGFWAVGFGLMAFLFFKDSATSYFANLNLILPLFVFSIVAVAASSPCVDFASWILGRFRGGGKSAYLWGTLMFGPLLGSLITEPAAMAVTAVVLRDQFFEHASSKFKYQALAVLFVNISIGGVLTHFAAPPVVMVAQTWRWNTWFMLQNFGWKAVLTCGLNAGWLVFCSRDNLRLPNRSASPDFSFSSIFYLGALAGMVGFSHRPEIFLSILAVLAFTKKLMFKESFAIAFFLAALMVFGEAQKWWLAPLIEHRSDAALFWGAATLTSIVDNASLTYLGSLIPSLSESAQYALVAGSVVGGGLTIIANAPNPVGYMILRRYFPRGLQMGRLVLHAALPTAIAAIIFYFL